MGKFGIPVAVQKLRSKVISVVLPVVLITSVFFSIVVYVVNSIIVKDEIDSRILENGDSLVLQITDDSEEDIPQLPEMNQGEFLRQ